MTVCLGTFGCMYVLGVVTTSIGECHQSCKQLGAGGGGGGGGVFFFLGELKGGVFFTHKKKKILGGKNIFKIL